MTADEIKRALKTCSVPSACIGCAYKDADECIRALITDALDLIDDQDERIAIMQESMAALEKRNEPVEPKEIISDFYTVGDYRRTLGWLCGKCGGTLKGDGDFCSYCGQAVKWE